MNDSMKGSYLGPRFENEEISKFLKESKAPAYFFPNEDKLLDKVCVSIEDEKIVGWFQKAHGVWPCPWGKKHNWRCP